MEKAEPKQDAIRPQHGGLVPMKYWQRSFMLSIEPPVTEDYVVRRGQMLYIDTRHPAYTRWLVGFVRGAAQATDDAIKRQMN